MIQKFSFNKTSINGLVKITPFVAHDNRGYFIKDYNTSLFRENNIQHELKEVFYTNSHKGVVRAIHFQREEQQAKLVRCISGSIYDVIVDLRKNSPTFGQSESFLLSGENMEELYIPGGCGHGYLVLEHSIVSYKCNNNFYGEFDDGIIWNDSELNINWPIEKVDKIILSEKDKTLQTFAEFKIKYKGLK